MNAQLSIEKKLYYVLRIAVAMCFIGHGAFGIITKPLWCNYFAVLGIGPNMAYRLMPFLGAVDILLGIAMLIYPIRSIVAWLVIWGIFTAALRPLSGEPFAEFIERAGNFGPAMVLLMLSAPKKITIKSWFSVLKSGSLIDDRKRLCTINSLRVILFLLFAGHGWLNLIEKKGLIKEYSMLGFSNLIVVARTIGIFEITAAFIVLIKPSRSVLSIFLIWKMLSELFYPHWEIFEWIERGGSYGSILALWFALKLNESVDDICGLYGQYQSNLIA